MTNATVPSLQRKWFGTDGIRGLYGTFPMTPSFAFACGVALARHFLQKGGTSRTFIVARDTRESGPALESALAAGLCSMGAEVKHCGVIPTGAVALLTKIHKAAAGVMISASHNGFQDNGIKCFASTGFKLDDQTEAVLETLIEKASASPFPLSPYNTEPSFETDPESLDFYRSALLKSLPPGLDLDGLTIVADCGHGAAWHTTPYILRSLGAEVIPLFNRPDGRNINAGCGSQHTSALQEEVRKYPGSIGLAHDGDADRVIVVDENAYETDGDDILAVLGSHYLSQGTLKANSLVATIMSNLGLDRTLAAQGGEVLRAAVGDRYVLEMMREKKLNLGGEQSGHMVFLDHFTTGDGLLTALQLLSVIVQSGKKFSELRSCLSKFPQKLVNLPVRTKPPLDQLPSVEQALREVTEEMADSGRAVLRYSGTENKIRLLIEHENDEAIPGFCEKILKPIRDAIGVES